MNLPHGLSGNYWATYMASCMQQVKTKGFNVFERKLRVWQPLAKFLVNNKLVIPIRVHCIVELASLQSIASRQLCVVIPSYSPLFESLACALKILYYLSVNHP